MKHRFLVLTLIVFSLLLPEYASHAIYGGKDVVGTERVVDVLLSKDSRVGYCSGALLTSRIVLTAGHCVGKIGKFPGVLSREYWSYWVSLPGVDITKDDVSTRVQSSYVVITDDYTNSYDPKTNDYLTTVHDIAFIFLSKPINISSYPLIANEDEVNILKSSKAIISHYGYGLSDLNISTGKPRQVDLRIRPRERPYEINNVVPEDSSIITDETGVAALCPGDSGGPWYAELNGKLLIVANTVGASGCHGEGSGTGGTFGTLVYKYESLLRKKWDYFVVNEEEIKGLQAKTEAEAKAATEKAAAEIKAKQETERAAVEKQISGAKQLGQYYQETTGCHASNLIGALQSKASGAWADVAPVIGWLRIPSCPETNPNEPWAIYNPSEGELLRWRIQALGQWEVFTNSFLETTSTFLKKAAADKAAADKAAADKAAADKAAASKKKIVTITCINGKISKRIIGVNPKCPSGFKKK